MDGEALLLLLLQFDRGRCGYCLTHAKQGKAASVALKGANQISTIFSTAAEFQVTSTSKVHPRVVLYL
jgi:hypothetical protein